MFIIITAKQIFLGNMNIQQRAEQGKISKAMGEKS